MGNFHRASPSRTETYNGAHRFEHWYRDNSVYFITARVRDRQGSFATEPAKAIFWDRFDHYGRQFGFVPWVTSLLDNHYHTEGYLKVGANLGPFMQRLHGSVAKLANDLSPERIASPFWSDGGQQGYFDGCLRDAGQGRSTFRYVLRQCCRHGICPEPKDYPHTRVNVGLERAIKRAVEIGAFMEGVPYQRYAADRRARSRASRFSG